MQTSRDDPPWCPGCEAALIVDSEQALAVRLALIAQARHSILAQYYSWEEDVSGNLLSGALLAAARRGIRIRLLVDDLYSGSNRYLESLTAEPNIRVQIFNPFWLRLARPWGWPLELLFSFRRLNHRMHNKLLVVDDDAAVVGGRNIGDSYLGLSRELSFVDLDIVLRGSICGELARDFMTYWRSRWSHPLHRLGWFCLPDDIATANNAFLLSLTEPEVAALFGVAADLLADRLPPLRWHSVSCRAVIDPPGKGARLRWHPSRAGRAMLIELAGLQQQLDIVTPYLVPTRHLYRVLRRLTRKGVRCSVLTNSLASTDMPLAYAGFRQRRRRLLQTGIKMYEQRPTGGTCLHAKLAILDRQRVLIGSLNLDPRSFYLNTEITLLIDSAALAQEIETWLSERQSAESAWVVAEQWGMTTWSGQHPEPETTVWRRCWAWLASWLPVHHLL